MSASAAADVQGEPEGSLADILPDPNASATPLGPHNSFNFEHAFPKPDGDVWEIVLKPALEADTTRCDAWKDEVQNLLIFAGLFSAVVTAFIIESYKFLQPDPNDAVVGLLYYIANSLNNTSPLPPSLVPVPFSQTTSSVRINVFWFISLILSLTTVLVGTVSLQWLREHQSYPNVTSQEKLAIFHMRSEALEAWRVPQIFSALPVLLQAALVLFLAGLIDFILPLGRKLAIPVSVIIGFILFFIAVTTALPACQGFLFLTGFYPHSEPPAPCAFKSPQSRVLLSIFAPFIRALSYVVFQVYERFDFQPHIFRRYTALPYLNKVLQQRTWLNWDQKWLRLRDAYHQCILDHDPNLYFHQRSWSRLARFPISDITCYLVKSISGTPTVEDMESFTIAAIHCFRQISLSIWKNDSTYYIPLTSSVRRNHYFEKLHGMPSFSVSEYLRCGGYHETLEGMETKAPQICHQDQVFHFLDLINKTYRSTKLNEPRHKLWSHIIFNIETLHMIPLQTDSDSLPIPTLLKSDTLRSVFDLRYTGPLEATANLFRVVFELAASHRISHPFLASLYTPSNISGVLFRLALQISHFHKAYGLRDDSARYISTFKFIANYLSDEAVSNLERNYKEATPSLLFYLASMFMWRFLDWLSHWNQLPFMDSSSSQGPRSLLKVLLQYRTQLQTAGKKNDVLETCFAKLDYSLGKDTYMKRFSEEWWEFLIECDLAIGLKATEQGPATIEQSSQNSHPNSSSTDKQTTAVVVATFAASSLPSASFAVVNDLPALNALAPDDEIPHTGLPSVPLMHTAPSQDEHDKDTKREAHPNSPTTAEDATATKTNEFLVVHPIPDPSFTDLQTSAAVPNPPGIYLPESDHAVSKSVAQAPSLTGIPLCSGDTIGPGPQEIAVNVVDDEEPPMLATVPHLTIEVESPIGLEVNQLVEITDSGDGTPEEQPKSEDAVVRIDSPN